MRQCLNYAVDKGYISSNPFSSVTIDSQRMLRRDTAEVVSHTKTAAGDRFVPLTSEAQKLIDTARQYQKEHHYPDNGYIFSINDKPLTERCISTLYTKYCKKLGIIQKSSHKARKTFVSNLLSNGVNINTVRQAAGHAEREPLTITCRNISKSRETLVNQGFPAHKKITVPTAPMSVKTVIVSARSGVRTLDTLIKSQVLYQLS